MAEKRDKVMYKEFLNVLPYIDLIFTFIGYIDQYRLLKSTKSSDNISVFKQFIHLTLLLLWILYGIEYCTVSYIITCVIGAILCFIEISMTILYRYRFIQFRANMANKIKNTKRKITSEGENK